MKHIISSDTSTTVIAKSCKGCGEHQTIAGALLKSKEWAKWCKHANEYNLFDVDETATIDAMSDQHLEAFMKFVKRNKGF